MLGPDLAITFLLLPTLPQCLEIEYRSEDPVVEIGHGATWWTAKVVSYYFKKDRTQEARYLEADKLLFLIICTAKSAWDDSLTYKTTARNLYLSSLFYIKDLRSIFINLSF
jgi:hypothetical protein